MTVWDSMNLNAPHTASELAAEADTAPSGTTEPQDATSPSAGLSVASKSNIRKADNARRCAECDCIGGGDECNWFGEPMAIITALRAEVQRCHERLEITHVHRMDIETGETARVDVPMAERRGMPDAVDCRDATIAMLQELADESTQAALAIVTAEKATWPYSGPLHDGARKACDNIATRIKQLMGDA
jgi:hypothetical protein